MLSMIPLLFLSAAYVASQAASPCPPRHLIYPCICISYGKRFTSITCHRLPGSEALAAILPQLRTLHLDHFGLYDSFWGADEGRRTLPTDWLTHTKIKEMEIVDTPLADGFMCSWSDIKCKNSELRRFTAINSSQSSNISLCPVGKGNKVFPWTKCAENLDHFQISSGKLSSLTKNSIFQIAMTNLTTLNLTRNQITEVQSGVFENMPNLEKIDLSYNLIEYLNDVFRGNYMTKLIYFDVSWNNVKKLGERFFPALPLLKTFKAGSNNIVNIKKEEWSNIPKNITLIELKYNPIHCDCSIGWINGTLFQKRVNSFSCKTPSKHKDKLFKRVALGMLKSKECNTNKNLIIRTSRLNDGSEIKI